MNNTICIIPARGGSKRIPKKNIKDFFGKPLLAYSIEAAKRSGLFDKIVVVPIVKRSQGLHKSMVLKCKCAQIS